MKLVFAALLFLLLAPAVRAQSALTITTEPNAIVWIDEIRRGTTDASGKLSIAKISAGRHSVRVRANGFKETVTPLLPGRRALEVKLVRTTDQAELLFQEAETAREKARDDPALEKAADLYRQAIKARPALSGGASWTRACADGSQSVQRGTRSHRCCASNEAFVCRSVRG